MYALKTGSFTAVAVGDQGTVLMYSSSNLAGWTVASGAVAAIAGFGFYPKDDPKTTNPAHDPPDLFAVHRRATGTPAAWQSPPGGHRQRA